VLLYTIIIWIVIFLFLYDSAVVYDISMQPTLNADSGVVDTDIVYYNKLRKYTRGDIIIVQCEDEMIIKRVVALGGDKVRYVYENEVYKLYINDQLVDENYVKEDITLPSLSNAKNAVQYIDPTDDTGYNPLGMLKSNQSENFDSEGNYIVPEDQVFVLGDNRLHSTDSKTKGGYDRSCVVGVVEMIITSEDNMVAKLLELVF